MNENKHWYVVYTRPRWEKKVALLMQEKGMEHYCPLNKVQKQWSDRKKVVLEPLFKGYVFVSSDRASKNEVLQVDGVLNFVHWLGKPAIVKESEIQTIKKFLHEFVDVEVTSNTVSEKDHVIIRNGVLMNYKGIVIEVKGKKARVRIESMGLQLSAVFDKKNLRVV
jgi:transcription antitermination factor NusG